MEEQKFSPLKGGIKQIVLTSLYFILLYSFFYFSGTLLHSLFYPGAFSLLNILKELFINGILISVFLPISIAIVIHKSFPKGLIITTAFLFIYTIINYFTLDPTSFSESFSLGLVEFIPIILIILGISVLLRGLFRIENKKIFVLIAVIPFLLLFLLTIFCLVSLSSLNEGKCKICSFGQLGDQQTCLVKYAAQKEDILICSEMKINPFNRECYFNLLLNLEKENKLDISICDKLISYERDTCLTEFAILKKDPKVCEMIQKNDGYEMNICLTVLNKTN